MARLCNPLTLVKEASAAFVLSKSVPVRAPAAEGSATVVVRPRRILGPGLHLNPSDYCFIMPNPRDDMEASLRLSYRESPAASLSRSRCIEIYAGDAGRKSFQI